MEFSRQEYWSGLPFPPPRDLPNPGIKLLSFVSPAMAGGFFASVPPVFLGTHKHVFLGLGRIYSTLFFQLKESGHYCIYTSFHTI